MFDHLGDFGHWLAGFIDGEGCFTITKGGGGSTGYFCRFILTVRDDDADIIYTMDDALGSIGRLITRPATKTSNPQFGLEIASQPSTQTLCHFLDEYPLRAKKAQDYAIWRGAVWDLADMRVTGRYDWSKLAQAKTYLIAGRLYPS